MRCHDQYMTMKHARAADPNVSEHTQVKSRMSMDWEHDLTLQKSKHISSVFREKSGKPWVQSDSKSNSTIYLSVSTSNVLRQKIWISTPGARGELGKRTKPRLNVYAVVVWWGTEWKAQSNSEVELKDEANPPPFIIHGIFHKIAAMVKNIERENDLLWRRESTIRWNKARITTGRKHITMRERRGQAC